MLRPPLSSRCFLWLHAAIGLEMPQFQTASPHLISMISRLLEFCMDSRQIKVSQTTSVVVLLLQRSKKDPPLRCQSFETTTRRRHGPKRPEPGGQTWLPKPCRQISSYLSDNSSSRRRIQSTAHRRVDRNHTRCLQIRRSFNHLQVSSELLPPASPPRPEQSRG